MKHCWYALYTRPRFEKKVEIQLRESGYEVWLPLQTVVRQWSDRKKKVEVPLFNGYVFIRTAKKDLYHVVQTEGIATTVRFNGEPAPIREEQIEMIRKVLIGPDAFEVKQMKFARGDRVRVVDGALKGHEGLWLEWRGKRRVALEVEHLSHTILIAVPAPYVKKIDHVNT
ncbi:MAG: UpxY family transcription antiterminator [Balneolales bacterium]